jgi:sugar phosphate isomerase/epimerase
MQTPEQIDRGFLRLARDGWKAVQASALGPIAPEKLKALADKHGLKICATHIAFDRLENDLAGLLKEHETLDCQYIGIGGMPGRYPHTADGYKAFARAATPIAERLRDAGCAFVYHNHHGEFARFGNQTGMDILLNESGDALQFELDTYWVQAGGGDVVQWIGKLAGRVEVVHFKDMVFSWDEEQSIMAEVGEGNLNWPAILPACQAAGVRWHVVEQDICRRDPFDCLKTSLENLKKLGL